MRQLKYIEDECFFKEIQAFKEFKIKHYCDVYDIANFVEDCNMALHIQEIENLLDSFELPQINSIVYTDEYVFVFNTSTASDLFKVITTSIKNGVRKMNDDNNPLKLKELQELNEQLMEKLDKLEHTNSRLINIIALKNHSESCETQTANTSSNISINSFNLFKW